MTKLTGAALDRAVAHAMGVKSVHDCEKWVGLTEEEVIEISHLALSRVQAVQMTEAKLREKNT